VADDDEPARGSTPPSTAEPAVRPSELAAGEVIAPVGRDASGSVEIPVDDAGSGPSASGRRRRATTASVITDHMVTAADKVVTAADKVVEVVGGTIGDVVGESLTILPGMPRTRRGAVLARGVVVGFCLVFSWIAVIVGLQLRGRRPPDFRPQAEVVLAALRDGQFKEVYEAASVRFQEVELQDTFTVHMTDLNRSMGRFREVASVIGTEVTRGPGGRTGRIDLRLEYERGTTRGSVSFLWEEGDWKLLGLSVEVPPALMAEVGTDAARRDRVAANREEAKALVDGVLKLSAAGDYDTIWNQAAPVFQASVTLEDFRSTEVDRLASLGSYLRVLSITSAKITPGQTGMSVDCLLEFAPNRVIRGSFEFAKLDGQWRLTLYKLVSPLPSTSR